MTRSDAARAAGWQVDARTADGAPERAISPGEFDPTTTFRRPSRHPAGRGGIPLREWRPP